MVGIDLLIFIAKHWIDEYSFSKDVKKIVKEVYRKDDSSGNIFRETRKVNISVNLLLHGELLKIYLPM